MVSPVASARTVATGWTVILPTKPTVTAKTRLVTLPAAQRVRLALAFARDAVTAILAVESVKRVIVVGDAADRLLDPFTDHRLDPVPDAGTGLLGAIDAAAALIGEDAPVAVMVSDLPCARDHEVDLVLRTALAHPISIVSDAAGTGTTMLTCLRRADLHPRFGERSRAAHVAAGAVDLVALQVPGLRRDVDTEVDLWDARRIGVGNWTATELADRTTR